MILFIAIVLDDKIDNLIIIKDKKEYLIDCDKIDSKLYNKIIAKDDN